MDEDSAVVPIKVDDVAGEAGRSEAGFELGEVPLSLAESVDGEDESTMRLEMALFRVSPPFSWADVCDAAVDGEAAVAPGAVGWPRAAWAYENPVPDIVAGRNMVRRSTRMWR